jgi:type IV secretory pathway VirB4 component
MAKFGNSQDLVEIEEVHDNTIILKDGGYRQILIVGGINFSLKSEEEQNQLTAGYQNFLNSIDFPFQVLIHSRKLNIDHYLAELETRMRAELSPLLQNQIAEYREFVRQFVAENAIMEKTFLLVISWYPAGLGTASGGILSNLPFFGKKKDAAKEKVAKDEDFHKNLQQMAQRTNQVLQGLSSIGLESVLLNDEQLIELFYNFYNPGATERETINLPK